MFTTSVVFFQEFIQREFQALRGEKGRGWEGRGKGKKNSLQKKMFTVLFSVPEQN